MGTLKSLKAVIPEMVERRRGHVIIVSSAVSAVSFLGYSSYAPTKHALRGLADALRNELLGLGIAVQIAYPPDTDTPGCKHENETKPPEVRPRDTLPRAAAGHVESQPPPPVCRLSRWCRLTSSRLRASRAALSAPQRRGKTTAHATPHHHHEPQSANSPTPAGGRLPPVRPRPRSEPTHRRRRRHHAPLAPLPRDDHTSGHRPRGDDRLLVVRSVRTQVCEAARSAAGRRQEARLILLRLLRTGPLGCVAIRTSAGDRRRPRRGTTSASVARLLRTLRRRGRRREARLGCSGLHAVKG